MRRKLLLIFTVLAGVTLGILFVRYVLVDEDIVPKPKEASIAPPVVVIPKKPPLEREAEERKTGPGVPEGGVRVVLISVDGFRTDLVQSMPGLRRIMTHGSWTLKAVTTVPSITTSAHATMFTGQPPEVHGVKSGAPSDPAALKKWHPLLVPTIFDDLDFERVKPTAFVQKEKLLRLLPEDRFERLVIDRATRESKLVREVCKEVAEPDGSRMLIVHFKRFDAIGHDEGWMSEAQVKAASDMDKALLSISSCIGTAQENGSGGFALIVTADHGGHGRDHDSRDERDMRIPWIVVGPGVKQDHEIRRDMEVMDTAAVVRYFLGYGEQVHDGIRGRFPREILRH